MDIEQLKLKTANQLLPAEKDFIKANQDKLNDEDKDAYKDFLSDGNEGVSDDENGQGDQGDAEENGASDEVVDAGVSDDEEQPATPAPFQFTSEDEAKEFVRKLQEEDEAKKQAAIAAAPTDEQKRYIEENWKPVDWNEGALKIADVVEQRLEEKRVAREAQQQESNKQLDTEWQQLAKENNLPDRTTEEGKRIHDGIVQVAIAHGKQNFHSAYELWSMIPEEKGGGYKMSASDAGAALAAKKTEQINTQKRVASRIGGQNQGGAAKQTNALSAPDYKTIHEAKSVHDLLKKTGVVNG